MVKTIPYHRSITLILLVTLFAQAAFADITVVDCAGRKRASKEVDPTSNGEVKVDVVDSAGAKANDVEMFLVNAEGVRLTSLSVDGVATFTDVASGIWVLGSNQGNYFVPSITLGEVVPPLPILATIGKAALVVGAITAGAIIVDQIADSGDGGDDDGSSSGTGGTCLTCDPNASAPSVPPFGE